MDQKDIHELEYVKKESNNKFGAETFSEADSDVLDDIEKIVFIFHIADESPASSFVDLLEFKKYYELLEKGYRLSEYQKRRINNANLFAKKRHEKLISMYLEIDSISEKRKAEEKTEKPLSAFSP